MATQQLTPLGLAELLASVLAAGSFHRATFGGTVRGASPWRRAVARRVVLADGPAVQCELFDAKQSFTRTLNANTLEATLSELLAAAFSDIHLETDTEVFDIRTSKKGKAFVRKTLRNAAPALESHNRTKAVPLPEGDADPLLEAMGITSRDGRVRPVFRAKYTQINEFLKHFDHCFHETGLHALGRPVTILDCGCGASYLTLAVHHWLNHHRGIPARLLGVDVNDDVIRKSLHRAERLGAESLQFTVGRIDAVTEPADVVIALHACDTATDAALAHAVKSAAKLILCVPCCHHHLNDQLSNDNVLRPILRHGILKQRQADLITDAFRALLLRIHGYRTEIVEFVSPEHTARNLMLRAVRIAPTDVTPFVAEYEAMKQFWNVLPYLETLIPPSQPAGAGS